MKIEIEIWLKVQIEVWMGECTMGWGSGVRK